MKITKHKLTQIIKEELANVLQETPLWAGALFGAALGAEQMQARLRQDPRVGAGVDPTLPTYERDRLVPIGSGDPQEMQTDHPEVHMAARAGGGASMDQQGMVHGNVTSGKHYKDTPGMHRRVMLPDGTAVSVPLYYQYGETTSSPSFKKRVKKYIMMAAEK